DEKRFVRILVVDATARLLVVRQKHGTCSIHCFPGGKVEARERPLNAAVRELREGGGLRKTASSLVPLFECPFRFGAEEWRGGDYITAGPHSERIPPLEYPKVDRAAFFSIEALQELPGDGPSFGDIAAQYQRYIREFARPTQGRDQCTPISSSRSRS